MLFSLAETRTTVALGDKELLVLLVAATHFLMQSFKGPPRCQDWPPLEEFPMCSWPSSVLILSRFIPSNVNSRKQAKDEF